MCQHLKHCKEARQHCDWHAACMFGLVVDKSTGYTARPRDLTMAGGEQPVAVLGFVLGGSLLLLVLGYVLTKWYREGRCWHRPSFVFNLYQIRSPKSVAVELAPPFTISGSMGATGAGFVRFHDGPGV